MGRDPGAPSSPKVTMEYALACESGAAREKLLSEVAWNSIETDPAVAHEAFERLTSDSPERVRLIQFYALRLAEDNPDEAIIWAQALSTDLEESTAIGQIALATAEADPQYSASLLSDFGVAGREFDVAAVEVIQRWASKSPLEAAAWVSVFPTGQARAACVRVIAEKWLPGDPAAVFSWMDSLNDPQLLKEAARAIQGVILQQPRELRNKWLLQASPGAQTALKQETVHAMMDVGNNIPVELQLSH